MSVRIIDLQETSSLTGRYIAVDSEGDGTRKYPIDQISDEVVQLREDMTTLQEGGYVADQQQIGEIVQDWLDDHPEATTTVEDNSLTTAKYQNKSVTTAKLDDSAVTTDKIADGAVTTSKLADGAVTTAKMNDGAVTTTKVSDSAIATAKINDSAVTTSKVNDGAITADKLADGAVTINKIANANVTNSKIADGAVAQSKLDSNLQTKLSLIDTNASDIDALEIRMNEMQGAVGAPLVAATKSAMTNTNKIYVYTGSESGMTAGNWYYYNGSAWVSGGVYNSTAINTDKTLTVSDMAADAKVTGDEITDLKSAIDGIVVVGNNLFDKTKALTNTTFDTSTKQPVATQNWALSDHIPVTPGETIYFTYTAPQAEVRCFSGTTDDTYFYQSSSPTLSDGAYHYTIGANVATIRIAFTNYDNIPNYNYIDRLMVNRGSGLLPYEPYGKKELASDVEVKPTNITGLATVATTGDYADLTNKPVIDNSVTDNGTNAVTSKAIYDFVYGFEKPKVMTRNIFDPSKVHDKGSYYFNTGLMEVEPSEDYYLFNQLMNPQPAFSASTSYYYDENKQQIGAIGSGTTSTFHTPSNARYVDLMIGAAVNYIDGIMVEKGSSPSWIYEPYGEIKDHYAFFNSPFYGKKYVAIGDSNTDQMKYPAYVAIKLGMYYNPAKTNAGGCECGRGGATMWMDATIDAQNYSTTSGICAESRIETLPTDAEFITLAGASNDAGQGKTIGDPSTDITMYYIKEPVSASDPSQLEQMPYLDVPQSPNFYNCYAVGLNRIRNRCPNATIFICEIPFRSMGPYETSGTVIADFFQPYRDAQEIIANRYAYPFIRTYAELGLNELNWKDYINHSQNDYGIHFNLEGNKLLAKVIASKMSATLG